MTPAIVLLAKLGDITNVLPIARDLHLKGRTPSFYHSGEYRGLFGGVSYAKPMPVRIDIAKTGAFVERLKLQHDPVLVAQAFGPSWTGGFNQPHNIRSWINCGYTIENFYDTVNFPLVFDKRDADREAFLCRRHIHGGQPLILLSLDAKSSPFNGRSRLEQSIRHNFPHCEVLSLSRVKAGRFYDLLGLMDMAAVLVTVDTSTLHLAVASKVKVIALIGDNEKTAAEPRIKPLLRVAYSTWLKGLDEISRAISLAVSG